MDPRMNSQTYSQTYRKPVTDCQKKRPRQASTPDRDGQGHEGEQLKLKFLTQSTVCGLRHKLQYPELSNFIARYDISCLTETKTDNINAIDIPGFCVFMKNRFDIAKVKSGGIIIAVKTNLVKFLTVHKANSLYVYWFSLAKSLFNLPKDILFGSVYIPPENTKYTSKNCFLEFKRENCEISHV